MRLLEESCLLARARCRCGPSCRGEGASGGWLVLAKTLVREIPWTTMSTQHDTEFLLVEKFHKLSTPIIPRHRPLVQLTESTVSISSEMAKTAKVKKRRTSSGPPSLLPTKAYSRNNHSLPCCPSSHIAQRPFYRESIGKVRHPCIRLTPTTPRSEKTARPCSPKCRNHEEIKKQACQACTKTTPTEGNGEGC
jgi:hypothetical protein